MVRLEMDKTLCVIGRLLKGCLSETLQKANTVFLKSVNKWQLRPPKDLRIFIELCAIRYRSVNRIKLASL